MARKVYALIPAHNEADCIAATLKSLAEQSTPIHEVLVVADNCTDNTASLARSHHARVIMTRGNTHMKAGALNQGLAVLSTRAADRDLVLVMDADSRLTRHFVTAAIQALREHPDAGAICATFAGEADRLGNIHSLQRNEYARFARSIARRKARAQVLSGVATLFPMKTLREVYHARYAGQLPPSRGVYDVVASTEDIELTMALQALGYRPRAPRGCRAYTDTMDTWVALARQRIRWQRGMLDALRLYGLNRRTVPYAARLAVMYLGSFAPVLYIAMLLIATIVSARLNYNPLWLWVRPLFSFERWWTVRGLGRRERWLAVVLFPEWLYENWRAAVYWLALVRWLRRTERVWVPT